MIILFHPRTTRRRNCRLPLSVLALAAVLEGREEYEIVDENIEDKPVERILKLIDTREVELLGVSVMPGPQMAAAWRHRGKYAGCALRSKSPGAVTFRLFIPTRR